jgi:hypothetical protein
MGDSEFCREDLMSWCEQHQVFYVFDLGRNARLLKKIDKVMQTARKRYFQSFQPQRIYTEFTYRKLNCCSRSRRIIGKAVYLARGENPRFVVTNLPQQLVDAAALYETHCCARREMENRIKEQQLYLFSDRTSSAMMRANQLRLYFSCLTYVLLVSFVGADCREHNFPKPSAIPYALKGARAGVGSEARNPVFHARPASAPRTARAEEVD